MENANADDAAMETRMRTRPLTSIWSGVPPGTRLPVTPIYVPHAHTTMSYWAALCFCFGVDANAGYMTMKAHHLTAYTSMRHPRHQRHQLYMDMEAESVQDVGMGLLRALNMLRHNALVDWRRMTQVTADIFGVEVIIFKRTGREKEVHARGNNNNRQIFLLYNTILDNWDHVGHPVGFPDYGYTWHMTGVRRQGWFLLRAPLVHEHRPPGQNTVGTERPPPRVEDMQPWTASLLTLDYDHCYVTPFFGQNRFSRIPNL